MQVKESKSIMVAGWLVACGFFPQTLNYFGICFLTQALSKVFFLVSVPLSDIVTIYIYIYNCYHWVFVFFSILKLRAGKRFIS